MSIGLSDAVGSDQMLHEQLTAFTGIFETLVWLPQMLNSPPISDTPPPPAPSKTNRVDLPCIFPRRSGLLNVGFLGPSLHALRKIDKVLDITFSK